MTVDDGTPGLRRRLNLLALLVMVLAVIATRACLSGPAADASPATSLDERGTSVSKDHGASTSAPQR